MWIYDTVSGSRVAAGTVAHFFCDSAVLRVSSLIQAKHNCICRALCLRCYRPIFRAVGVRVCEQLEACYLLKLSTSERVAYLSKFNNKYRNIISKEGEMSEVDELGSCLLEI